MSGAKRTGGASGSSGSSGGGGGTVVAVVAARAPLSNHESFLLILHDAAGRAALLDYLKAGYSEHHLIFWEEATQVYAKLVGQDERNTLAQDMWHRYIKNGSKSQINITEPQRLRLQSAVERIGQKDPATGDSFPGPGVDLFDDAASTCLELIKGNYFFPFQSSKQFERYKAEKQRREDEQARADAEAQQAAKKKGKSGACVIL